MKIKPFPTKNITELFKSFQSLLIQQKLDLDKISTSKSSYQTILKPIQDLESQQDFFFKLITHIHKTNNSKESQKIYLKSLELLLELRGGIFSDKNLFEKIKDIKTITKDEQSVKDIYLKEFTLSGIELEKREQLELQRVDLELKTLANSFSQNVIDSGFNYQEYLFLMQTSPNRKEREEAYKRYASRASKNAIVETPSQFLENFAYEERLLREFSDMDNKTISSIKKSRYFHTSFEKLEKLERSIFDIKLHQKLYQGDEIQTLLDDIREETSVVKTPPYNKMQNSFGHIFSGGYASGYYSYLWSKELSSRAFKESEDLTYSAIIST